MARNVALKAQVRTPRAMVLLNGVQIPFSGFEVENHIFSHSDRATVRAPASSLPAAMNMAKLVAAETITLEILAGFVKDGARFTRDELQTIFQGDVDVNRWVAGDARVEFEARCFSAALVDAKTSEQYRNLTASAVVTKIAGEHGLTPVVTATTRTIGRYYRSDTAARTHSERTKWDLLVWLAREEGFVVYVKGKELHFEPRPEPTQDPYLIEWAGPGGADPNAFGHKASASQIEVSRNLTQSESVKVIVRSWNPRDKRSYEASKTKTKGTKKPVDHVYNIPGLTAQQTTDRAAQILNEITRHQLKIVVESPADDVLKITDILKLEGSPYDGTFYIDSISRRLNREDGYVWTIEGKTTGLGDDDGVTDQTG
jgi:hypothetical protein